MAKTVNAKSYLIYYIRTNFKVRWSNLTSLSGCVLNLFDTFTPKIEKIYIKNERNILLMWSHCIGGRTAQQHVG